MNKPTWNDCFKTRKHKLNVIKYNNQIFFQWKLSVRKRWKRWGYSVTWSRRPVRRWFGWRTTTRSWRRAGTISRWTATSWREETASWRGGTGNWSMRTRSCWRTSRNWRRTSRSWNLKFRKITSLSEFAYNNWFYAFRNIKRHSF